MPFQLPTPNGDTGRQVKSRHLRYGDFGKLSWNGTTPFQPR